MAIASNHRLALCRYEWAVAYRCVLLAPDRAHLGDAACRSSCKTSSAWPPDEVARLLALACSLTHRQVVGLRQTSAFSAAITTKSGDQIVAFLAMLSGDASVKLFLRVGAPVVAYLRGLLK